MPVAAESCGRCGPIVRSLRPNRTVVAAQTCGRCGPIVRSLRPKRAVVAGALYHKKRGITATASQPVLCNPSQDKLYYLSRKAC